MAPEHDQALDLQAARSFEGVGSLLANRKLAIALCVAGILQLAAGFFGFRTFQCPMLHGTGIPCPGCGASRACGALLRGDVTGWLRMHAMAPVFLLAALLFTVAAVLSASARATLARVVTRVERRTGITVVLLVLLFLYWLARLLYAPAYFVRLMREQ